MHFCTFPIEMTQMCQMHRCNNYSAAIIIMIVVIIITTLSLSHICNLNHYHHYHNIILPPHLQFLSDPGPIITGCHSSSSFRYMLSLLVNKQCHQVRKGFIAFLLDDIACQQAMTSCKKGVYRFLT